MFIIAYRRLTLTLRAYFSRSSLKIHSIAPCVPLLRHQRSFCIQSALTRTRLLVPTQFLRNIHCASMSAADIPKQASTHAPSKRDEEEEEELGIGIDDDDFADDVEDDAIVEEDGGRGEGQATTSAEGNRRKRGGGKTSLELKAWIPPFIDLDNLPGPRFTPEGREIPWYRRVGRKSFTTEQWDEIRMWKNKVRAKRTKENKTKRINEELNKLKSDQGLTDEQIQAQITQWKTEKKEKEALLKSKMDAALRDDYTGPRVVIDCTFIKDAVDKEKRSLCKQIEHSMVANKKGPEPIFLGITGYEGVIKEIGDKMAVNRWPLRIYAESTLEIFPRDKIVVLSPDAEQVLETVEPGKVYVIGGIVDRTVKKNETKEYAEGQGGLECRRLPVKEHVQLGKATEKTTKHPKLQVLNINEVFEAILHIHNNPGDWAGAMERAVPTRKKRLLGPEAALPESDKPVRNRPVAPAFPFLHNPAAHAGGNGRENSNREAESPTHKKSRVEDGAEATANM